MHAISTATKLPARTGRHAVGRVTYDRLDRSRPEIYSADPRKPALEWCSSDARCRAAVNLDGALWTEVGRTGLDRLALQLLSDHAELALSGLDAVEAGTAVDAGARDAERAITLGGWRAVESGPRPADTLQVRGATHLSFMDVPFLRGPEGSPAATLLDRARIAPRRIWRVTRDLLLSFLPCRLDGAPVRPLVDLAVDHPELTVGAP